MVNFSSEKWFTDSGFYPHEIDQSARFDKASSAYLTKTPSSATNQRTWTWSGWLKNTGDMTSDFDFFTANGASAELTAFMVSGDEQHLQFYSNNAVILKASADLRDTASWYHIMCRCDTTQSTASNRLKFYINGTEADYATDARSSSFAEDFETGINDTVAHYVGCNQVNGNLLNGYLAEVHFTDGVSNAPSAFGETKEGVWIPKAYTGSYGTNGFYLKFDQTGTGTASASTIGADSSGNNNHFTTSAFASTDSNIPDSPTNNFCTWNELANSAMDLTEGSLAHSNSASSWKSITATFGVKTGKWYWEILSKRGGGANYEQVGIALDTFTEYTNFLGTDTKSYGYNAFNGNKYYNTSYVSYGASYADGDIVGVALDMDNGTLTFYKNNSSQGEAYSSISGCYSPAAVLYDSASVANFGQDSSFAGAKTAQNNADQNGRGDFYYSPPAGYLALCTANLPEPTISPLNGKQPSDYFNTVLYTGDDSTNAITGVGFQPDLVWLKNRDYAVNHRLYNALTYGGPYSAGASGSKYLKPNATTGDTAGTANSLISLDSDGFTVHGSGGETNDLNEKYVAWNWLAGNGTTTNDASSTGVGSTDSVYSVNTTAGFSIVTYTGTGSATTIAHGLGVKPNTIWIKRRTVAAYGNWSIYVDSPNMGAGKSIYFDLNNAAGTSSSMMNDTEPTSSVFTVNTSSGTNTNTHEYIAFCFSNVEGYSKFGEYTGNGNANGSFVYTGFRPAWVMFKRTDSTASWFIADNKRDVNNVLSRYLFADLTDAENTAGDRADFLSNGFKARVSNTNQNASGGNYIYMAFAEMPFKYANAR